MSKVFTMRNEQRSVGGRGGVECGEKCGYRELDRVRYLRLVEQGQQFMIRILRTDVLRGYIVDER